MKIAAFLERFRHLRTIGAQGFVSSFHFALNLALLRLATPHDYGVFAFAFVLAMFATAVNHALISTPLLVYTPVIRDLHERGVRESMLASANLLLCAALAVGGALWAFGADQSGATGVGLTLFVTVYSARQYSRSIGYARLRPLVTAAGDIAYVAAGLVFVGVLWLIEPLIVIGHVLGALTLAMLIAMLTERIGLARLEAAAAATSDTASARPAWRFSLAGYAEIWEQSRWSLAGALTTLLVGQAHSLIVTSTYGPEAFAPLAAGFVLFGPVRVALQTWQNTVKPELAIGLGEGRLDDVRDQIRRTGRLVVIAVLVMGACLLVSWPIVHELLYARRYADEPMARIVLMWFLITLVGASYNPASAALQSMRDFRALAIPTIWGALVSGTLVWVTLALYAPAATLWGILVAETLIALWLPRLLAARLAERRIASAHSPIATGTRPDDPGEEVALASTPAELTAADGTR